MELLENSPEHFIISLKSRIPIRQNSKGFLTDSKWSDAHVFSGRIFLLYLSETIGNTLYLITASEIIRIAGYRSQSSNVLATSYDKSKSETTITNSEGGCSMYAIRIN